MIDTRMTVTNQDIEEGTSDSSYCPIATAIRKKFGIKYTADVDVNKVRAYFRYEGRTNHYSLSEEVREWIDNYDNSRHVSPIILQFFSGKYGDILRKVA